MNSYKNVDNKYDLIAFIWNTIIKIFKSNWKKLVLLFIILMLSWMSFVVGFKCKTENFEIEKKAIGSPHVK